MVSSSDRRPWHRRRYFRPAVAGLVATVITGIAWIGMAGGILAGYHGPSQDPFFPRGPADDRIVVVGIDARSIREIGEPWPWPRSLHARLVEELRDRGAAAVGYDVVFDLPGEGDEVFESALADGGGVILAVGGERPAGNLSDAGVTDLAVPLPAFAGAATALGHALTVPGPADGVVRHVPLAVTGPDGSFLPALSLATVAVARGHDPAVLTRRPDGVQVGDRLYPTEEGTRLRISFAAGLEGPDGSGGRYLSAVDVLEGDVGRDLSGAVVFVGATDPLLGDTSPTPVRKAGAGGTGVYVHANAANTMLTGRFLVPVGTGPVALAVLALAFLVTWGVMAAPLWAAPVVAAGIGGGFLLFASWRFDAGEAWSLVYPTAALLLAALAGMALRYLTETRERRLVADLFAPYVPAAVADLILEEGLVRAAARGDRREVSVLFCDVRGFTRLAGERSASDVSAMLALYYELATGIVLEHGGTLMQYVGDEVFAVFGTPLPQDDHADRATACAIELQRASDELASRLAAQGLPRLDYGIGLHAGEVVAAHIGGAMRRQYSVIGATVNVGSRVCSVAGPGEITCTGELRRRWSREIATRSLGPVALKGVDHDPDVHVVTPGG